MVDAAVLFSLIPLINVPSKRIAFPNRYRDALLERYGTKAEHLVTDEPIVAIFTQEGLVLFIIFRKPEDELSQFVFHPMSFEDPESPEVLIAGKEVYEAWKAVPTSALRPWEEVRKNAQQFFQMDNPS